MVGTVWYMEVKPGQEEAFEDFYTEKMGPFLLQAPGFFYGDVERCIDPPQDYVVTEWWDTKRAFDSFVRERREEYAALLEERGALVVKEQRLGWYEEPLGVEMTG